MLVEKIWFTVHKLLQEQKYEPMQENVRFVSNFNNKQ